GGARAIDDQAAANHEVVSHERASRRCRNSRSERLAPTIPPERLDIQPAVDRLRSRRGGRGGQGDGVKARTVPYRRSCWKSSDASSGANGLGRVEPGGEASQGGYVIGSSLRFSAGHPVEGVFLQARAGSRLLEHQAVPEGEVQEAPDLPLHVGAG